ncbi:hypothetical protein PSTT_05617 [Puccinia striiformis]|uniref:Uncharacterized protein n=1 Tax=Puccinia striiformis TaxID=27350 RepID=A0A2S4VMX6_9BASI|nr:hypothetical protein PSTT_05617 [Puccinia striiformis]
MVQIQLRGMATSRNLCLYAVRRFDDITHMGPALCEDLPMRSHTTVKREIGENAIKVSILHLDRQRSEVPSCRRPTRQQNRTPPNEGGTGGDGTGGGGTGGGTGPACPVNEEFKQGRCRKCPRGQTRRVGQPTCRKQ